MLKRIGRTRVPLAASLAFVAIALLTFSCGKKAEDVASQEKAITEAINAYLRDGRGLRPDAMKMELHDLSLTGDEAHVHARFSSAGAPGGMEREYHLHREAGAWKVVESKGESHGEPQTQPMPPDHPPLPTDGTQGS
jgi:hypothetical protein